MPEEKMKGVDGHAATVLDAPRRFDLSLLRGHHATQSHRDDADQPVRDLVAQVAPSGAVR